MNEIIVLWSHPYNPTIPPLICPDTGKSVKEVVADFRDIYSGRDITFNFMEEICPDKDEGSGRLIIDDIPLEDLVPLHDPSKYCGMSCGGCGSEDKQGETSCGRIYEQIPESVLRLALSKATNKRLSR